MWVGSITRFGMVGCVVRDHTMSAVTVIPGVLETFLKGGACLFGEIASVLGTLWQPEQTFCA
jgi:hypothetical protein